MPDKTPPCLQAALDYAKRGWLTAPLHWIVKGRCSCGKEDCHSPGKHPLTQHGLKDASKNAHQIRKWWKMWPEANVAIITGKESGLVVLDFDDKGQGVQVDELQRKGKGNLPHTPQADTGGGGRHYFFSYNGTRIRNKANLLDLTIDVRGEGGYVVAPPSRHISGGKYVWRVNHVGNKLAPLPPWLQTILVEGQKKHLPKDRTVTLSEWGNLWTGVTEPGRNVAATRLAGRLLGRGLPREEVEAILQMWNVHNAPPMSTSELKAAIASINRAEEQKPDKIGVVPADYFLTADISKPEEIISKGIFPEASGLMLTGESGAGKSLLTLEIAIRLSKGMPIWEHDVSKPRQILFIQKENPDHTIKTRLRRICRGLGVQYPEKIFFADRKFRLNIGDARDLRKIKELIEKTRSEVVILDPLSSYHYEPENDNIKMRRVLDNLTDISGETGCAWIVVHHEGKPGDVNKLSKWRFRGATSIRDWADTMIGYIHKPNNEAKVMRILTFDKVRHGPEPANILLERDENFIHHIVEEDLAVPTSLIAEAFSELGGKAKSRAELYKIIAKYADVSRATIYRAIDNAENRVWIQGDKALIALYKM